MTCFLNLIIMKKNYWNGLVLKLKRTLYPINRILHLFSYLSLATKKSKKMKFCYLMLATYSFNPSVPIFILTIFVVILRIIINSNMISIASSAILSTLVFYILPVNALLSLFAHSLLEQPKYKLQDIYRSLSILAEESDYIQAEVYRNSNFLHKRNTKVLYYDCTNYYFEIEQEDELKKYGKSKEHRPNPIVGMGLFMDGDGFPLAFDIFPEIKTNRNP